MGAGDHIDAGRADAGQSHPLPSSGCRSRHACRTQTAGHSCAAGGHVCAGRSSVQAACVGLGASVFLRNAAWLCAAAEPTHLPEGKFDPASASLPYDGAGASRAALRLPAAPRGLAGSPRERRRGRPCGPLRRLPRRPVLSRAVPLLPAAPCLLHLIATRLFHTRHRESRLGNAACLYMACRHCACCSNNARPGRWCA